ncbi:glycosyl transferase family 39 [Desulfurobacterium thermolithotrophum DSM 11699]|uniref:Glycosyl transferase family 39 n=1 Tax=Desulfurobacterium thermolithotrophum (strain DSM 11699 / BSA) TaxID=868864 RepID=F0S0Y1_DESTD|nr:glycosyltransferase family 39 protein [Desulfurobacterium thermolithotrophum]ADY72785.1 glycosyl transferase family 39 [Desulfurobacterium thermolithotrophum DSM 11699]
MQDRRFWLLALISTVLLLLPNGFYSAFDKDEPKYMEAAWEMVKTGDYITPYYNYEYRFDKPILVYWLIALGYKIFGINEFGGRFFVSIFGVFTVLLLYWWLTRWKGRDLAFWTSLVFLSLLDFIVMSSVAMPDVVLTFFFAASLIFFFEAYHRKSEKFYLLAFASSGFATLTKGPVGLALPGLVAIIYLLLRRDLLKTLKEIPWFKGFGIYLLIVAPWYVAIFKKHGYQFFKDFIIFHNIHRFTSKVPGHPTEWWYYLANYFWLYLPWSFFFPFALYRVFKRKESITDNVLNFSLVWFFTVVIFFQIAHTKLAHYLLPSFPAFAVITSWYLSKFKDKIPAYITAAIFIVFSVIAFIFFKIKGWPLLSLVMLLPVLLATIFLKKDYLKPLTFGFIGTMVLFKWITLPSLEFHRAKPAVGKEIQQLAKKCKECKFYFLDYTSPEIVYYFKEGKLESIDSNRAKALLRSKEPVIIVTRENRLKKLKGESFYILDKKKELITKHSIVIISNYPKEKIDG